MSLANINNRNSGGKIRNLLESDTDLLSSNLLWTLVW